MAERITCSATKRGSATATNFQRPNRSVALQRSRPMPVRPERSIVPMPRVYGKVERDALALPAERSASAVAASPRRSATRARRNGSRAPSRIFLIRCSRFPFGCAPSSKRYAQTPTSERSVATFDFGACFLSSFDLRDDSAASASMASTISCRSSACSSDFASPCVATA